MSKTLDQGKEEVAKLCQYFATNRQAFLAPGVKEAHVCQTLLNPFFEALGWDVSNTAMVAPQYRKVIAEDSVDVQGHQQFDRMMDNRIREEVVWIASIRNSVLR